VDWMLVASASTLKRNEKLEKRGSIKISSLAEVQVSN